MVIEASQERIREEIVEVSISLMLEGHIFLIRTIRFFIPIFGYFCFGILLGLDWVFRYNFFNEYWVLDQF